MMEDLAHRFTAHPADEARQQTHEEVRRRVLGCAKYLDRIVPDGREKSLAMTNLEQAMFWANAAVARHPES